MIFLLIDKIILLYQLIIVIRVILSWVQADRNNPIMEWLDRLTEPVLGPARKLVPATGGFDFSPLIVLLVLEGVRWIL
jgi:YggT family protein